MAYRRATKIVLVTLLVYAGLVAAHEGEFWPFSIYPMFSQGGQPWSRAVVRDVTDEEAIAWHVFSSDELPGRDYALQHTGIDGIDLANFVSKTERWDANRIAGLQRMFHDQLEERRRLLVMRVNGRIDADDVVRVEYMPYVLLGADTTAVNPQLPR